MKTLKKNVFIGPLPPPLGGVAVINQSFQSLSYNGYTNLVFDTSNKNSREDLYKGLPWQNIFNEYKKVKKLKDFIKKKTLKKRFLLLKDIGVYILLLFIQ